MGILRVAAMIGLGLAVAGCGGSKGLRTLDANKNGPDEFLVLPVKPLSQPPSYDSLPEPTPGATNLVDTNPKAEAVAALGGRPAALEAGAVPAGDGALVQAASRNGVSPDIRQTMAAEDEAYRKRRGRFTSIKLFNVDRYDDVYRPLALDPFSETERFRRAGVTTPAAPPATR